MFTIVYAVRRVAEFLSVEVKADSIVEAVGEFLALGLGSVVSIVDVRGERSECPEDNLGNAAKAFKRAASVHLYSGERNELTTPNNPHYMGECYDGGLMTKEQLLSSMTPAELHRWREAKAEAMRMRSARKARRSGKAKKAVAK